MVDRMVPWLLTSAMASFLNMGEKVRRNSVSKTEFRLFPSRTVHISRWFCSMGHSWSYSLCDRHSICPLRLGVTQNILDKLPNLGRELYWQMAFFLWLCVFLWIHHTATPLIIFLTQPNSHQINHRHHTHIFLFNWRPSSTSNITELSNELWCHIKGN